MMTRREFVTSAVAMGATPWPKAWPSTTRPGEPMPDDGDQRTERHILLGKRMVFTNWYFVRPGTLPIKRGFQTSTLPANNV